MAMHDSFRTRRDFLGTVALGTVALGASAFVAPGAFAEELLRTPRQTEGPFYPDRLPLETVRYIARVLRDAFITSAAAGR